LENEWLSVDSSRRRAHYNNLSPGQYTFQILAANNEGVWVGRAKELSLVILPAWWQTWWAKTIYLILLLLTMYLFSFWRLRSNRAREKELKRIVDEQTFELKEANRSIMQFNNELEQRVTHRTRELSVEIEERRESEEKARHIAYHDGLTGLFNRAWLLRHLKELIALSKNDSERFALFFIGGDKFRRINDTYGHVYGDMVLTAAAKRLVGVLPEGVHAVRLGSDEFTVVFDRITSQAQAIELAERITDAFTKQFTIENVRMNFSVSVGIMISNDSYTEPAQVLRSANVAMQHAKDQGGGVCQLFDEFILQKTLETAALERDLKSALTNEQFRVVYQPVIIVETGELSGFEILLRWHHPERGLVPPDKFIPMAESLGLIFDIGLWVLTKACQQIQQWQTTLNLPMLPKVAVNLSPIQLEHTELLDRLSEIFLSTGVERAQIAFEITESALMKRTDTVGEILESLRSCGIELAIDDFGTGYSSLSYLGQLPVQVLKIDKTFIAALTASDTKSESAHEIVRATISLAHNLKMRVVAEGIETADQLATLKKYDCDYGQGYFIARPLSPEHATEFLIKAKVARLTNIPEDEIEP
jgi:diguanylate cyclase (GGDEF)-like protein